MTRRLNGRLAGGGGGNHVSTASAKVQSDALPLIPSTDTLSLSVCVCEMPIFRYSSERRVGCRRDYDRRRGALYQ